MKELFYKTLVVLSRRFGPWVFTLLSRCVSTGYFILFPKRRAASVDFYQTLFPEKSRRFHLACAWKQYHNFTTVFLDRFQVREFDNIGFTSEGFEHIEASVERGKGGILLMSHLGNWEIAAYLLKQKRTNAGLLLYMGARAKEQIERLQKEAMARSGVKIAAVAEAGGSPFDIVEGISFLKQGGLVAMTGDVIWHPAHRSVPVQFLGRRALLPAAPHVLALVSGAPLHIFFSFRTGKNRYHFTASEPIYVTAETKAGRQDAIAASARRYASALEAAVRQYPFQWYHFTPFFRDPS